MSYSKRGQRLLQRVAVAQDIKRDALLGADMHDLRRRSGWADTDVSSPREPSRRCWVVPSVQSYQ
jgi:hypothetical protein